MYFNRKNAEQKNWRMIKKGKHFLFGCSLVFAVGAALVAPSVKADAKVETEPEAGSTTEPTKQDAGSTANTNQATAGEADVTYAAPAAEAQTHTEANAKPAPALATPAKEEAKDEEKATEPAATPVAATTKESDSVVAPSLTPVADASALTAEEISNVTEAIKGVNPTATDVKVSKDGSAVVTFKDGSSATLAASQTVKVKAKDASASETSARSRRTRALNDENAVSTRAFDSELQDAAQKTAIYSPGVKGEKQTYQGTAWLYRNGTISNSNQEDAKRLGGVNVYLQYVTGKGFVSPVYKTTSEEDGTFVFDLSKPVANRLGATGEFQLAGDPNFAIRTWVENPDPKKYNVVKAGDQRTGFHTRLVRLNESWNFTAGINRITGGQVVLQEKPNSEDYLLKPEAERETGDLADGQFSRKGDYGTIRGSVWYDLRDPMGSDARMYKKDSYDINATNVKVAASYLNDEVTNLLDAWKKAHKNYKLDDFKAAQAEIIKAYEAEHGKGSHIAETVVAPVDKDGNYRLVFRGLYGVSSTQANTGLKISHTISDEEFGKLVKDEDLDNNNLLKWSGAIGQKHRHINTDYVYTTVLVDNYDIWSNNYQANMFEGTGDAALPAGPSSLAAANISNTNFALIAPQPMHDVLVYDNNENFAKPGNTAESTTGGLIPSHEYQIRWFKDGKPIGEATTVMSTAEGTAQSVPLTVPTDLNKTAIYTSGVFLQGQDTSDLNSALALDSFTAVPAEETDKYTPKYADTLVTPGTPATVTPKFKDKDNAETKAPEGATYSIPSDFMAPEGYTVTIDPSTGAITTTAKPGTTIEEVDVPVTVTYSDKSTDSVTAKFKLDTDGDKIPDVTDEDDDNDGVNDTDETTDGTNTKDPNSIASKITPIDDQTGVVGKEITPVTVTVEKVPTDGSVKVEGLPDGVSYDPATKQITGTPTTEGVSEVTVTVLGKDGNPVKGADGNPVTETFTFTVTKEDKDKYTPTPKEQSVNVGETPDPKKSIGNVGDLPDGTKFEYKTPVDTKTPGDKDATVVVTYPDGSKDEVPVKVTVTDPRTDADKNTPTPKEQTVNVGETPDPKKSIGNVGDLPDGTKFEYKTPVDTKTPGDKDATVVVTYPDGSKDEVPVKVTVTDPRTDADKNTPTPKEQTVNVGETPDPKKSIGNVGDLPDGTKFEYKTPVDTKTPGDKDATVVVTYPDGSKDEVPVKVTVTDPRTDADKNTPTPKEQTVNVGETPDPKKSIGNVGDLPDGTKFEYKTPVDTKTPGDKKTTVVVTYPDGSKDEVPVTVKVVENPTQADKNEPTPKDQTVNVGETPDPKKSIGNVGDLPDGTKFEYKTPVDTKTPGDKKTTVVVTYPDGSKDEVPVTVKVVENPTQADKNEPTPKDQTVNVGETPDPKKSIGNVGDLPDGTKFEYKTPVDTKTPGDKKTTVVVTYPDGSKDEVPVTVKVVENPTQADKNEPTPKDQTVNVGETPDPKKSIGNVGDLPDGTKFEYKTPVDTKTPGDKDATVVVTYPDGSKDEVPVKVTVTDPRTDADKNTPKPKEQTVNVGETPDPKKSIGNVGDLPDGTKFEYKTPVDTKTPGDKDATVVVTYPDGSKDEVPVKVTVTDPRTDADKNTPTPKEQTVNVGETPDPKKSIGNVGDLPDGTKFEYKTPVDTTTPGDKDATVVVTYPDGSKDEVPVKVTVTDPRTDADKNTPTPKEQTVNVGETPDPKKSIGNVGDLPDGTKFEYKTPVDTKTPGDKDATVVVTYPDGSKDEVPVKVTVTDPRTDADKNTPTPKEQTVNVGETPDPKKSIGNVGDLPDGTKFEYKTPVDTTTPGDKDATVVVTYPDGSKDEVPVKVTVTDPRTDADKNTPTPKEQTVNVGETPDPKKSIGNVGDLPDGTKFEYKIPVDTTTPGDKDATVVVTYPDGSKDEVPVKVTVKDPSTDADKNTPVAKDQTVNKGETPNAKDSIGNVGDLPDGTKFEYKTPVDTKTPGDKDATVVVTYPDGSKDEVPVKVTVTDPRTDADKNTPTPKEQTVNVGETPDPKKSIGNVGDLPDGTKFEYKTPVDTKTPGDKKTTVVVTYPDGSKDEVPVTVKVVENPTQADKNEPTPKDQTVNVGETPDPKKSIGNVGDLPDGTKFEYKTPVDTKTPGDKKTTVVVTYPDGSKDEVPVTVKVVENPTQADKNEPTPKDQTVNVGETPDPKKSIGNVGDLPDGTKFEYKTPVDTKTPGDKKTTVVVTYPDGSKDEVPVTVKVVENPTQADKNEPTPKDQTVNVGETPDPKKSIGNVGDLPDGTKFEYKTPVDTKTPGDKDATVVVTYPDGSKDEVPVKVTVTDPRTDADKNTPKPKEQTVNVGETPDPKKSIGNVGDLPDGTKFEYKTPVDTKTPGDKDATVVVTYPDGSKDEVPVKVTVTDPRTDADKNTPTPKEQTVNVGETPDPKKSIGNVGDLPDGTKFEYKTPVDTTTPGDKDATVVVTYPDGSKDEVPVKVTVTDPRTDADKNTPTPKEQTVNVGETPDPKKSIGNVGDLPDGTKFEYKTPVDTKTPGDKDATVVVTYPDGSKDEVPVKVTVTDPRTDADKNTPTPKEQTVNVGETPDPKKSIGNVGDLPDGTKFEYKTPVDTTTPGDKDATVVVTYPDGSKDEVPVKVTVTDPRTDADKNTPTPKEQTVNVGETPDPKKSIGNVGDLPDGTKFEYKIPVDTTTPGDKDATVVVTYPDGSKDEVPVKVTVKDPSTDADKNTPVAKDQTVNKGETPNAKDSIGNVGDLPDGTKFEYKTPVDTTTPGVKDATVVVTYPDGSMDEVPVKVTVADNSVQASDSTPAKKEEAKELPNTGTEAHAGLAALGLLGALSGFGLLSRKKKED